MPLVFVIPVSNGRVGNVFLRAHRSVATARNANELYAAENHIELTFVGLERKVHGHQPSFENCEGLIRISESVSLIMFQKYL